MKEFLIVYIYPNFAYSPSVLNLYLELKKKFYVELVVPRPDKSYSTHEIKDPCIKYFDDYSDLTQKERFIKFVKKIKDILIRPTKIRLKEREIISYIKRNKHKNKEIIAVDFFALWCAQIAGRKAHFLSLEIYNTSYSNIKVENILSVIIQSEDRYKYLFPKKTLKYFIVQNSPKFIPLTPPITKRKKTDLIYCGSAMLGFGIISCLDFIKDYKEYTLTTIGAMPDETMAVINSFYNDLIEEKRLIINTKYFSLEDLTYFVSKFRVGFVFYDFFRFENLRVFNYFTAPSGKCFQYLNSGVPVVASNVQGFKFLEEKKCGELVDFLSSLQIKKALDKIENDYEFYAKNAKSVSRENDFEEMIQPFIKYISS